MTRKDFTLIATALLYARPGLTLHPACSAEATARHTGQVETWRAMVREFARVLRDTNKAFDRERFIAACGYED